MLHFIHTIFDLLALCLAMGAGAIVYSLRFREPLEKTAQAVGGGYFIALSLGSILGSFILGTANLYLSGSPIIGRSILGTLFGAIVAVEIYKLFRGVRGSTGYLYVLPFCVLVAVGRLGCFFAGLDDHTYGIQTNLPWGVDFGDGVTRHPVQLYESIAMAVFALFVIISLKFKPNLMIFYGFYLCVGFYAAQRFAWEFLKPYGAVIGGLNLFHIICFILIIYIIIMSIKVKHGYRSS